MKISTRRIFLNAMQKSLLEEISNRKIFVRNSFELNQQEISQLMKEAEQNALIYLQRNKLGQKLSLLEENNLFVSLVELQKHLHLQNIPRRIECYDISHLSGKFVYGSMVTFIDGMPQKKLYKLFKCKDQNNDFENHAEVLNRRLNRFLKALSIEESSTDFTEKTTQDLDQNFNLKENFKSIKKTDPWALPDLIIVDGGKGQLSSDFEVLNNFLNRLKNLGLSLKVDICALAKREEEVFLPHQSRSFLFENNTKFLLQRVRDEAHRFAIKNNRQARINTISKSQLDEIPGIGKKTKEKLLIHFGSQKNLVDTLFKNPELVYEIAGKKITEQLKKQFSI